MTWNVCRHEFTVATNPQRAEQRQHMNFGRKSKVEFNGVVSCGCRSHKDESHRSLQNASETKQLLAARNIHISWFQLALRPFDATYKLCLRSRCWTTAGIYIICFWEREKSFIRSRDQMKMRKAHERIILFVFHISNTREYDDWMTIKFNSGTCRGRLTGIRGCWPATRSRD